jgi:diguanylate cyclase (GGDEF)-like protein/PAS domain S-box-containing protein
MDGSGLAEESANRASVGLVVVRDGAVAWANGAARAVVEPIGTSWTGPAAPLAVLADIAPGAGGVMTNWLPPGGDAARWWQVTCTALAGAPATLLYEIVDRTSFAALPDRHLTAAAPLWRLDRLEALARMGSWVWDIPENRNEWSDGLSRMFGLPAGTVLQPDDFRTMCHPDDLPVVDAALVALLDTGEPVSYAYRLSTPDGRERVVECHGEVVTDPAGAPVQLFGTVRDITEEHEARTELAYLAEHDPLTGIANRRRITARLAECAAQPSGATLLLIDIDRFKDINDLRGHGVGDAVIRRIAELVTARLDPGSMLGRLGGDEFAAVLPFRDPGYGVALGEKVCDAVAGEPIVDGGSALRVTVSIGVTGVAQDQPVEASLARADLALYEAKNGGRNRVRLSEPDQFRQAVVRVGLEQRIADALDNGAMQLDAQPIIDLGSGQRARWEVLIRLRDGLAPELGPADFLPAAERTDLVLQVDRWVLASAIEALATERATARDLRLEVNLSARSLEDPELADWVLDRLGHDGVAAHRLGLEITETSAIASMDAAQRLAGRLTAAGCGFALDDFGSGFGSFSHLKHLPFTAVKIAGEFVHRLDTDRVDQVLVGGIAGVAEQLGMRAVAEQVDRPELMGWLRRLGVTDGQGFHLGRPRPLADLLGPTP